MAPLRLGQIPFMAMTKNFIEIAHVNIFAAITKNVMFLFFFWEVLNRPHADNRQPSFLLAFLFKKIYYQL
jgi:hypothetical protein